MSSGVLSGPPKPYSIMEAKGGPSDFTRASDRWPAPSLRTWPASKPAGKFLELGTGTGLSTSWILDGMDGRSTLISIDNDEAFLAIARRHLANDKRLRLVLTDGARGFGDNQGLKFYFIFADTWH